MIVGEYFKISSSIIFLCCWLPKTINNILYGSHVIVKLISKYMLRDHLWVHLVECVMKSPCEISCSAPECVYGVLLECALESSAKAGSVC